MLARLPGTPIILLEFFSGPTRWFSAGLLSAVTRVKRALYKPHEREGDSWM